MLLIGLFPLLYVLSASALARLMVVSRIFNVGRRVRLLALADATVVLATATS